MFAFLCGEPQSVFAPSVSLALLMRAFTSWQQTSCPDLLVGPVCSFCSCGSCLLMAEDQAANALEALHLLVNAQGGSASGRTGTEVPLALVEQRANVPKLAKLGDLVHHLDNPVPRKHPYPVTAQLIDLRLDRGFVAVSKGASKAAEYEYLHWASVTSYLHDATKGLEDQLVAQALDKTSLLVILTHLREVLRKSVQRLDYLKIRGEHLDYEQGACSRSGAYHLRRDGAANNKSRVVGVHQRFQASHRTAGGEVRRFARGPGGQRRVPTRWGRSWSEGPRSWESGFPEGFGTDSDAGLVQPGTGFLWGVR